MSTSVSFNRGLHCPAKDGQSSVVVTKSNKPCPALCPWPWPGSWGRRWVSVSTAAVSSRGNRARSWPCVPRTSDSAIAHTHTHEIHGHILLCYTKGKDNVISCAVLHEKRTTSYVSGHTKQMDKANPSCVTRKKREVKFLLWHLKEKDGLISSCLTRKERTRRYLARSHNRKATWCICLTIKSNMVSSNCVTPKKSVWNRVDCQRSEIRYKHTRD